VIVIFAILTASFSIAQLPMLIEAVAKARGAASKLFATIDRVPPIDSANPGGLKPEKVKGTIALEDVQFNYPARPGVPIFKDLSISFAAGKTSALVGASGSGKSTIVSLIERFYDPFSGSVSLDGYDLRLLNLKWLRSQIGLVSQEPILFATTIRGNVEHGLIGHKLEHATAEEKFAAVREACIKANADVFISKLPLGYDTMVGERGFLLSGGQKQRIAIARAIVSGEFLCLTCSPCSPSDSCSDPLILLLDEATSALDTQSEGIVQNALDKASRGRTTITIAHRLSAVKDADIIHVIGEGEILESGTHQELLRDPNGPYTKLFQAQNLRDAQRREAPGGVEEGTNDNRSLRKHGGEDTMDEAAMKGAPLGRIKALDREIVETRYRSQKQNGRQYPLVESFRRMANLNQHSRKYYYIGVIAAIAAGALCIMIPVNSAN
jgi:ATP-binding cassette subfamily B (MDR/TAP) protein 1